MYVYEVKIIIYRFSKYLLVNIRIGILGANIYIYLVAINRVHVAPKFQLFSLLGNFRQKNVSKSNR